MISPLGARPIPRLTGSLPCVILMMLLTATTAWAQDEISGLTHNTEGGYYVIPDAAALEALATYVNDNGKTSDKTFKLTADIDFADVPLNTDSNGNPYNFTPIGFGGKSFSGKFYGNGNTISNLIYETNPSVSGRGLFGKTEGATIDGVTISGITITGTAFYMGGLVGFCGGGGGTISNSTADVDVTGTESTGGFVGHINYGGMEISDCRADGFTSGGAKVGGFVGSIGKSSNNSGNNSGNSSNNSGNSGTVSISNCVARGDVRSSASNYGGFIGNIGELSSSTATLSDCWCSGAVWGMGGEIGAFVGYYKSGTIQNCSVYPYATGLLYFCGNNVNVVGGTLSATDVEARSKDKDGTPWPKVRSRAESATPIATAKELIAIADITKKTPEAIAASLAGCYVLVADIDLDGNTIVPIGNAVTPFTSEFYGQGHQISNFEVETADWDEALLNLNNSNYTVDNAHQFAGLFGNIQGGRVNGVQAEGSVSRTKGPDSDNVGVGGFAGYI